MSVADGRATAIANAVARLLTATGRASMPDALAWIAQGYALSGNEHQVLQDLAVVASAFPDDARPAASALTRKLSRSDIDSAAILFRLGSVAQASAFEGALARLATKSKDKTLATVDGSALLAGQREDPFTIEALAAVAGLSYTDLQERAAGLPADSTSAWTPTQINNAFAVINQIITGTGATDLPGAVAMRPLDLMPEVVGATGASGWEQVEAQRNNGVPYAVLLAQRAAGGAWLAHRNTTSGMLSTPLAQRVADAFEARKIGYIRSTAVGGDVAQSALQAAAKSDGQIGILALDIHAKPVYGIAFSSARDSGTASKNANRLRNMQRDPSLATAVLVSGRGWSARNETGDLAMAFDGRLFSDQSIDALADDVLRVIQARDPASRDKATA